jgi:hypothetical protein
MLPHIIKGLAVFILFLSSLFADPAGFNVLICLLLFAAVDAGFGVDSKADWSAQIMHWMGRFFSLAVLPFYLATVCAAVILPAQKTKLDPAKALQVPVRKMPLPAVQQTSAPLARNVTPAARPPGPRPPLQTSSSASSAVPRPVRPQRPLTSRPGGPGGPGAVTPTNPASLVTPVTPKAPKSAPASTLTPDPGSN